MIGATDEAYLITTNATLQYSHADLLGSQVQAQAFYRSYNFGGGIPFDGRELFGIIYQSPGESEQ